MTGEASVMYSISRNGTTFEIKNYPWDSTGYRPKTFVTLGYDDEGYKVHFVSYETKLKREQNTHNHPDIFRDSCMELFMQFAPETDENYINFEINPNGAVYCALTTNRENYQKVAPSIIDTLDVKIKIHDDRWEIDYYISKEYIQNLVPTYKHKVGNVIRGNFYKCAEKADDVHYGCFNNIEWEEADFHRPEFFAEFKLV